jgi:hypothetical protein
MTTEPVTGHLTERRAEESLSDPPAGWLTEPFGGSSAGPDPQSPAGRCAGSTAW